MADDLCRGTYYSQHAARGVELREIVLLYGAQGFRRGGIAAEYNQMASHIEQAHYCLTCELIHDVKRAWSVWRTGIVAQVQEIILGQQLAYAMKYGQTAIAGIEYSDRTRCTRQTLHKTLLKLVQHTGGDVVHVNSLLGIDKRTCVVICVDDEHKVHLTAYSGEHL